MACHNLFNGGRPHNTSPHMTPSEIRSQVLTIGEACDHELTFQELVRFLPAATLQDFIQHMHEVADIDDIA